jgi:hypothetical protein
VQDRAGSESGELPHPSRAHQPSFGGDRLERLLAPQPQLVAKVHGITAKRAV